MLQIHHFDRTANLKGIKMTRKIAIFLIMSCFGLWVGCAVLAVGTGVGVGTYTYLKGDLKRTYNAKFDRTLDVCLSILADLNQPILEKTTDGEKTVIQTKRKNTSPQTITVSISSVDWTEVSVRSGVFGYWNREVSQQFHEFIEDRLNR
jgi:hypothetical protein